MFSTIANYFSPSSHHQHNYKEFDADKASVVAASLHRSRMEASVAKTIEALALQIQDTLIGDMKLLIERLRDSAPNVNESQQSKDTMKELPVLIELLSRYDPNAKLSTLPSAEGIRVASVVTSAAHLVKIRTEQRQLELLASLDQATRGRFKASIVVDAESRRSARLHTLQLCNLTFDSSAKNALRATLRNHQIVVLDLTNCFLGDDETMSLLDSYLSPLSQLSVLSLAGNALTNKIVPYFISSSINVNARRSHHHQNMNIMSRNNNENNSSSVNNNNNDDTTTIAASSNNNSSLALSTITTTMMKGPAYLESSEKFLALRVLNLDDNEISPHHLVNIKAKLALRWQRYVKKYDPNATISFHRENNNHNNNNNPLALLPAPTSTRNFFTNDINNNDDDEENGNDHDQQQQFAIERPTTTVMNFRNTSEPSIFLSLDGNGLQGIGQAKFLAKNPHIAHPHQATVECIVATSCSVITACALALGNISLENVCNAFKRLQEEVFSRTENDAIHYVESAGMYIRSWWYCGEYYSSTKAKIILDNLFGTAKFSDFPCSRVIVVLESSNGQVLYASSPTSSPLWNQCHTFLPNDPFCPTVSEICLAAMAAPGRFAPRKLYKSRAMTSAASVENRNNYFAPALVHGTNHHNNNNNNLLQPPSEEMIVFDACASIPNPAHIALIEAMGPTTKPRRLISIATESGAQVANSILPASVASIAASALSSWPNTRVVLSELEFNNRNGALVAANNNNQNQHQSFVLSSLFAGGSSGHNQSTPSSSELRTREEAYTKLLANHSYIARAASDSVERALESTLANEDALRSLVSNGDAEYPHQNNNNRRSRLQENNNQQGAQHHNNSNPIRTSNNNSSRNTINHNKNDSITTTAIYYERLFPLDARAPELRYDETSTRILAVAIADNNVAEYAPQSSSNFNRYREHYNYYNQRQQQQQQLHDDDHDEVDTHNNNNNNQQQQEVLQDDGFDE